MLETFVIVGAGLAGAKAAETLIRERVAVDDHRLADPDISLDALVPAEQEATT